MTLTGLFLVVAYPAYLISESISVREAMMRWSLLAFAIGKLSKQLADLAPVDLDIPPSTVALLSNC